ncbi:MAG: fatty acid hydroxylase family protein [Chitinophagia bacterium]|nr:fatty acid hydroxylase family protein [Chitinophagia bacterium]
MTLHDYLNIAQKVGSRYFIVAGIAFLICYVILRSAITSRKIQQRFPKGTDYLREIGYSIFTIAIFGTVPLLLIKNPVVRPHTTLYTDIAEYGWAWFLLAFPVMTLMHDTYFYWTHRLMHHPALFRWFHLVHHRSTNPSPWAAYAFHPLEAVVEVGIFAVFLFTIPIHPLHFALFFLFSIMYNVYGHLGWELYPKGFSRHPVGRWVNTSVNHNQHHQHFKGNYGLYFLFWDRWMGTIREDYEDRFEQVKDRT